MALGGSWATLPDQHVLSEHIASEAGAVFVYKLERVPFLDFFLDEYEDDDGEIRAKGVSCSAWGGGLGLLMGTVADARPQLPCLSIPPSTTPSPPHPSTHLGTSKPHPFALPPAAPPFTPHP